MTYLPFSRLVVTVKLLKTNGEVVGDAEKVSVVNNLFAGLFKSVECYINGSQTQDISTPLLSYKMFSLVEYSHSYETKYYKDRSMLYYPEEPKDVQDDADGNLVIKEDTPRSERKKLFTNGKPVTMIGPMPVDLFQSEKFLPSVFFELRLTRNDDGFCILKEPGNTSEYKLEIVDIRLRIRRVFLKESLLAQFQKLHSSSPYIMEFLFAKVRSFPIKRGTSSVIWSNMNDNQIVPKTLLLQMVETEAFDASATKDPFKFQHFNLNQIEVYINNQPLKISTKEFNFDPSISKYGAVYPWVHSLDQIGDICHMNTSLGISLDAYHDHKTFFCFQTIPNLDNNLMRHEQKTGGIDVHFRFSRALPKNITVLAYLVQEGQMRLENNGQVTALL